MFLSLPLRGANKVEMVRTREDMLLVEECEEEEGSEGEKKEEEEEEGWCPLARLEEHNLEWVIQVNYSLSLKREWLKNHVTADHTPS